MPNRVKPTALKLVEGNPGKRALKKREPKPRGNLYDAPAWFSDDQRESWEYAIETAPHGLLKRVDRNILTTFCVAESAHRLAAQEMNAAGALVYEAPSGFLMQTPYLAVVNKQAAIMMKAAAEMGFTPASRTRVEMDSDEGQKGDDADEFFNS